MERYVFLFVAMSAFIQVLFTKDEERALFFGFGWMNCGIYFFITRLDTIIKLLSG